MSTMYYTHPEKVPIGQTHFKGKNKGYHFTWTILPLDFAMFYHQARQRDIQIITIVDEYGNKLLLIELIEIVTKAASQSFEEGIE